jgi:hypothetical protein
MAALGFNTEEGERGEWAGWAKWPHGSKKNWAGEGGKMDQASREFGPKPIWAA